MTRTHPTTTWARPAVLALAATLAAGGAQASSHREAPFISTQPKVDATDFYRSPVQRDCRSLMNVPFHLKDKALDAAFLKGAEARGLVQLKGHRVVGGMRASIYNAMPIEGVHALVDWMQAFEREHR